MLEVLKIRNLAVIDSAEVSFQRGLNIISGETGAGKSIVIEAISLLLGSRASGELIRAGCEEASVEGIFDVSDIPWLAERSRKLGFRDSGSQLLIRRKIHQSGKNRIYVNGELATLGVLQELTQGLVDLCGQHEHQSLLSSKNQMSLIDQYGGLEKYTTEFSSLFGQYRSLLSELERLRGDDSDAAQKVEFLKFQIDELRVAELCSGEDVELQSEKKLYQSAEQRFRLANQVRECLVQSSENSGSVDLVSAAIGFLKDLLLLDSSLESERVRLESVASELEDLAQTMDRYVDSADLDPDRYRHIQDRLALIASFRRKYGTTVDEMLARLSNLENELQALENIEVRAQQIEDELHALVPELRVRAQELSGLRKKVASLFSKSVTAELKDLNMAEAQLGVNLTFEEDESRWSSRSAANLIEFCILTNKGERALPLGKIASGGELSRIMLSIRRVISNRGGIGVYLFDEIDSGIGGPTAFQVGSKLRSVAEHNQVVCITHLPQVAAFGAHHLVVSKKANKDRTVTTVQELGPEERKKEIARMLGGPELTKTSLQNADELIHLSATM